MEAIVIIISRHSLVIEAHCRNQPSKSKLALHKPLLHFYSHLKQLHVHKVTRQSTSVIKVGVACVGGCVLRQLKEELAWATDKWVWVISKILLFKTVIPLRN